MNTKQMIVGMTLIVMLGLGWQMFLKHEWDTHPEWIRPGQETASPGPAADNPEPLASATGPQTMPATTQSGGPWHFVSAPAATTRPIVIGSAVFNDPNYRLALTVSPSGAGLDSVVLNQYDQEVGSPDLFAHPTPDAADKDRPLGTTSVVIDGAEISLADARWTLVARDDHSVKLSANLQNADSGGIVRIEKQFVVDPATDTDKNPVPSQGYETEVNYVFVNQTAHEHDISIRFNGPAEPRAQTARQETQIVAAYDDSNSHVKIAHQPLSALNAGKPAKDFVANDDKFKLIWLGASSNDFDAIVRPLHEGQFASAVVEAMNPDSPPADRLVKMRLTTTYAAVPPGGSSNIPFRVFFGPRRRDLLASRYYSAFPLQYAGPWHFVAAPAATTQPVVIGSLKDSDPLYHIALTVSPSGAGLDSVVLNQYKQEVDHPEPFTYQTPYPGADAKTRPLGTTAVVIDGVEASTFDATWTVIAQNDHSITFAADLQNDLSGEIQRIEKEFVVDPATDTDKNPRPSQGYETEVNYVFVNQTAHEHDISIRFNGPTEPRAETARQETEVVAGYDDKDSHVKIAHQPLSYFNASSPTKDFVPNDDKFNLIWLGASSNYFNAIVHPLDEDQFSSAVASAMNPDSPSGDRLVTISLTTKGATVPAAGTSKITLRVFFGPKQRTLLYSSYYSQFPRQYDQTLVMVATGWISGICGLCTSTTLINILVALLAGLHFVLRDWGLAIIALVCGVRVLLHPITKRSQTSMMKMQKLAPEMERLKKKFGDDKDSLQKAQVELYKGVGFTPILGCLPMFLQMPIFIALWRALQTTFELRQSPFLFFFGHHLTWIHDLSQPDGLIPFAHPILLPFGWTLAGINALPIAMAVVTYINQKYFTPKPVTMSPEQEQQQKMMTMMMPFMLLMFYTFPSGLNLYYLTSTSLGIIESKIVRNHIKRAEELEKLTGPVIVDAGKATRSVRRLRDQKKDEAPKKKGFMQRLQEKAEAMARQAEQQKKRNR